MTPEEYEAARAECIERHAQAIKALEKQGKHWEVNNERLALHLELAAIKKEAER